MQESFHNVGVGHISRLTQLVQTSILSTCFPFPTPARHAVACVHRRVGREQARILPTHPAKRVGFVFGDPSSLEAMRLAKH